jgi:WD40 repeat protein/DNA-binding SARP family transcriptional activator
LEVVRDGESIVLGAAQQRAALAVLVLRRGDPVSVDRMVDELWGERAPATAAKTVQVYVSHLRKALGAGAIVTQGRGYRLAVAPEQIDVVRFEALCGEGRRALAAGDPARAQDRLRLALGLWRGEPLADFAFEPFAQAAIARLQEARLGAVEDRIEADLALGGAGELIGEIESLIASNPLQERLRRQLMLALYRAGRQADALAVYRETVEVLREELGLDPGRPLRELERAILEHAASLDGVRDRRGVREVCPFKGLAFFDRADAAYFCGREGLVSDLLVRLVDSPLVGILGPSGIGKSSLLRAGVLPALSAGALPGSAGWRQVLLRPGTHPSAELARALAGDRLDQVLGRLSGGERLVVAVDQFEELFTVCELKEERAAFLAQLVAGAGDRDRRALVVLSLRADFYGRFVAYPRFAGLLSRSHVLVGPMDREELTRAIERPAARAGLELEAGLADALISDVAGEPGGLPLLSTALLELWRVRDGRALRYDAYRASGGVRGAVARLAEDAYTHLSDSERRVARSVMLRLAAGVDGALARRRVPVSELERVDGAPPVLAELIDARLLTVSDGEIELSHEALLREWPRYSTWLEEDRTGRRVHAHLTAAARDWDERGRDLAELYRGARLATALEWRAGREPELNQTERAFLDASRAAAGRAQRRLRLGLAAMIVLLALALGGGVVALDQRSASRNQARIAEAGRLGAQALTGPRLDRSLLLAREGVALDDSPVTRGYLLDALLRSPAAIGVMGGDGSPLTALDLSPNGRTLAAGDTRGNVLFFDASTRRRVGRPYRALRPAVSALRFSPDGALLAVVDGDHIEILDARTHQQRSSLSAAPPSSSAVVNIPWVFGTVAFSPDSRVLAADVIHNQPQQSTADIVRWGTRSGQRLGLARQVDPTPQPELVGFAARGAQLVTSSAAEGATVIRNAATLQPLIRVPGGGAPAALSPNGRLVALGAADGSVRLLNLQSGGLRVAADRGDAAITDLRFTPDSRRLLTAGADGRLDEWNVADAQRIERFTGQAGSISRVAISPDGNTAYTAGEDGTVTTWDLAHSRRLDRPFRAPPRLAIVFPQGDRGNGPSDYAPLGTSVPVAELGVVASPDGRRFLVPDDAGYVDVFDSRTLTQTRRIPVSPGTQTSAVALAPNGHTVAATTADGQLRFADLRDPERLGPLKRADSDALWSLAFSRDGRWLATTGTNNPSVQLWDVRQRTRVNTSDLLPYAIAADVTFSPDATKLAVPVNDFQGGTALEILSVPSLATLKRLPADAGTTVRFSPDGRLLAFGDVQGRVWLYDTRTWRARGGPLITGTSAVVTVTFSPDGQTLATTSDDGTTRLWDVPSGRPIGGALPSPAPHYVAAAFVDGGTHLVTLQDNGTGSLWDVRPQSWARRACQVAGRTLTRQEWTDALPDRAAAPACATP